MPWATAVGLSGRSSAQTLTLPMTLRRPAASTVAFAHSASPMAGRRKRIDSSDVRAIGSTRPIAVKTAYHNAASARLNCVGPEMNPPGRTSPTRGDVTGDGETGAQLDALVATARERRADHGVDVGGGRAGRGSSRTPRNRMASLPR